MRLLTVILFAGFFSQISFAGPKSFECDSPGLNIKVQEGLGDYVRIVNKSVIGNHPEAAKFNRLIGLDETRDIEIKFKSNFNPKCDSEMLAPSVDRAKVIFDCHFFDSEGTLTGSDKLIHVHVNAEFHKIKAFNSFDREAFTVRIAGNYLENGKWKEYAMIFDEQTVCKAY